MSDSLEDQNNVPSVTPEATNPGEQNIIVDPKAKTATKDPKKAAQPAQVDKGVAKLTEALEKELKSIQAIREEMEKKSAELDSMMTKAQAVQTINEEERGRVIERHKGKAERMKEHLMKQEKVSIFIPLEGKEKPLTVWPVTMNGYTLNVPKGVYVRVPKQVAENIMNSMNLTEEAISSAFRLDIAKDAAKNALDVT